MKHITLSILLLLMSVFVLAQDIKYKINSTTEQSDKSKTAGFDYKLIYESKDFYYFDLYSRNDIYVQQIGGITNNHSLLKVSKDLKTLKKKEIELNKREKTKGIFELNNNLVAISLRTNNKENTNTLNIRVIDKNSLNVIKTTDIFTQNDSKYSRSLSYELRQSKDKSKLAILYTLYNSRQVPYRLGIIVIGRDLEVLWSTNNFTPSYEGVYSQENSLVANNGDVYALGRVMLDDKNNPAASQFSNGNIFSGYITYDVDKAGYQYQLNIISNKGLSQNFINLSISDYDIRSVNVDIEDDTKKIFCYGIFSDKGQISAKGTFISEIDMDAKTLYVIDKSEFSKELITKGFSEKELKSYNKSEKRGTLTDPFDYDLSRIKYKTDGSKYFIAEQKLYGNIETTDSKASFFNYNDIYIIGFSKKNRITNIDKVSKRQAYNENKFISYSELYKNNKHYLIFNTTENKFIVNCLLVSVDNKGHQKSVELYKYKNKRVEAFVPARSEHSELDFFIYTRLTIKFAQRYYIETLTIDEYDR